ncbi:type VI secretion system tube protein Hcp, partial [Salmonella enterica]|nr:type VI secretion system tube protein Hcp [Salmonella enterica]
MGNLIYLTLEGNIQGQISAGCSSQASVGNRHQLGHENAIFVFSLTQAESGS